MYLLSINNELNLAIPCMLKEPHLRISSQDGFFDNCEDYI